MRQRKIKLADACDITGYQRDELNYVLRGIPSYSLANGTSRKSREFTPLDLLTLSVVFILDRRYGLRLKAIAQIIDLLHQVLAQPRSLNDDARLMLTIDPPAVNYVDSPKVGATGIVVALKDVFSRVDHFCSAFRIEGKPFQSNLALGPGLMQPTRLKSSSK